MNAATFTPEFDLSETGHLVAPVTCRDCGEVAGRLSFVVIGGRQFDAIDCPTCMKTIAINYGERVAFDGYNAEGKWSLVV